MLNGGKEKALNEQDIDLDERWSPILVVNYITIITILVFKRLAEENGEMAFLYVSPGLVKTDIFIHLFSPESSDLL